MLLERNAIDSIAFFSQCTDFIVINLKIIPRANLLFQDHEIYLPLLQKAPSGLLKNAKKKKNRNFQNFKLVKIYFE